MNCVKCLEVMYKEDKVICSDYKSGGHYYCLGIGESIFNKMLKTPKNKWSCNEYKIKWNSNKEHQISKEKVITETLAELVQYVINLTNLILQYENF